MIGTNYIFPIHTKLNSRMTTILTWSISGLTTNTTQQRSRPTTTLVLNIYKPSTTNN